MSKNQTLSESENIKIKKINDEYSYVKYGSYKLLVMNQNQYINATKMCREWDKEFRHWKENNMSKELIKELALSIKTKEKNLILIPNVDNKIRGSYVHPLLITHIACWCGPNFAIKIGIWIEEWKKYSFQNELAYWDGINEIKPSSNFDREKQIQKVLHKKLGGEIEAKTTYGKIDLLTEKSVIEIKTYNDWKCAIGQLIAYSEYYPDKEKIMYLFDVPKKNIIDDIELVCSKVDIKLKIFK